MRRKQSARTRFLRRIVDSQAKKLYNGLTEKRTAISFLCGLSCCGSRSVALSTDEKDGNRRADRAVGRRYSDQPDLKKRRGA